MAKNEAERVQQKVDRIMRDARREVGIWSVFGIQEVRDRFWAAWQSGKDLAMRYTMFDAVFMMIGGKEETLVSVLVKLAVQYAANLTLGLVSAFFFFLYHVYQLLVNYGEDAASGLAFFLLVLVASASLDRGPGKGGEALNKKHRKKHCSTPVFFLPFFPPLPLRLSPCPPQPLHPRV
ncbi:CFDP1 [Symbiodinium natans]|uniref:CFDP1 protein n=1 Tax=Symbiodinium natans TaxID=878477 RepID=A0A812J5L2_9DINO|nr:CFDP1 [Symbiodinium natans]